MTPPLIPHIHNVDPVQNRVSCYASQSRLENNTNPGYYSDTFHGRMWNFEVQEGDAVYGRTETFSSGPLDHLGKGKFVRVPYRRIPRIDVTSYDELLDVASSVHAKDKSIKGMWRGQNRLHSLESGRTTADFRKLYGSEIEVEPSLLPSALRLKIDIDEYTSTLFGLLDVHFNRRHKYIDNIFSPQTAGTLREEFSNFRSSYLYRPWAFGVAQHYGLPSTGLDVTSDIEIAAFFALHEFTVDSNGYTTIRRLAPCEHPVVYLMGIFENDLVVDSEIGPQHVHTPRASAQKAHFFSTAWGASQNRAAERIVAVFDLVDHTRWQAPDLADQLFPPLHKDHFASFFKQAQSEFAHVNAAIPLSKIYYR